MIQITHRWSPKVLWEGAADSLWQAVEMAVSAGADLSHADLSHA